MDRRLRAAGVALVACVRVAIERTAAREVEGFIMAKQDKNRLNGLRCFRRDDRKSP
jgi:hypothetical protein